MAHSNSEYWRKDISVWLHDLARFADQIDRLGGSVGVLFFSSFFRNLRIFQIFKESQVSFNVGLSVGKKMSFYCQVDGSFTCYPYTHTQGRAHTQRLAHTIITHACGRTSTHTYVRWHIDTHEHRLG